MGDVEIDFETVDSPNWPAVRDATRGLAWDHLNDRFQAATIATTGFLGDAHQLVDSAITKPPGKVSGFGALVDIVSSACEFLIPEEALMARMIYGAMHAAWEEIKTTDELLSKYHEGIEANSVEAAQRHLLEVADQLAESITRNASRIIDRGKGAVDDQLDDYVRTNPQVFQHDRSYYEQLCNAIGIVPPDKSTLADQMINATMKEFRPKVLETAAALHFFHEMGSDTERLEFLIKIKEEQGTDPDRFLELIGADRQYWDQFLGIYRAEGKDAAMTALVNHLTGF